MSSTFICRACLNKGYEIKFLEIDDSIREQFNYCIGIKLESTLQFFLCESCSDLIQKYAEFKRKCLEADNCYYSMQIEVSTAKSSVAQNHQLPENELKLEEINSDDEDHPISKLNNELELETGCNDEVTIEECSFGELEQVVANEKTNAETKIITDKSDMEIETDNNIKDAQLTESSKKAKVKTKSKTMEAFKCTYCYRKSESLDNSMELHKETCKKKRKFPDACGLCNFKNDSDKTVKDHVQQHFKENMLSCSLCDYNGRDFAHMVAHSYEHLNKEWIYYNFFCPCCNKTFMNVNLLEFHFRSVHLSKIGGLCSLCGRTYNTYREFRRHLRFHKIDGFVCDNCNRKFVTREQLIIHLNIEAGVKPYVCDVCGSAFNRSWYLKNHIRLVHTKYTPATCNHCGRKYKSEKYLKKHLKFITREKRFHCDYCSQTFVRNSDLKSHLRGHSEQKHKCRFCAKIFNWKTNLTVHEKLHMGLNPFKCHECDMEFRSRRELLKHRNIHEPTYLKCPVCPNKKFKYNKQLKTHCKQVHKLVTASGAAN